MRVLLCIVSVMFCHSSFASIYKCKNSSGKTIYSESPCSSNYSVLDLDENQNVIESSNLRKFIRKNREVNVSNEVSQTGTDPMTPHEITTRIRALKLKINDSSSLPEEREDANTEYQFINQAQPKRLSYDLEQKRRNLKVDLTSSQQATRREAVSKLRNIYLNYLIK